MFRFFAGKAAGLMVRYGAISAEDRDLYEYGAYNIIAASFHILTFCIMAAVFRVFWEYVLFYTCYKALRRYAGGYHANTSLQCYVGSCVVILGAVIAMRYGSPPFKSISILFSLPCSAIAVFALAPVETPNKPLDRSERLRYRGRARAAYLLEAALCLILYMAGLSQWAFAIAMSFCIMTGVLLVGKLSVRQAQKKS